MGFIDKVKASVKTGAEMAATKAQEEYERVQARRDVADAYESLGVKAFELADRGDLTHPDLGPLVDQVRAAKTRLDSVGKETPEPSEAPAAAQPDATADEPPSAT